MTLRVVQARAARIDKRVFLINLRAGLARTIGEWRFTQLLRVDNAAKRRDAGPVTVNERTGASSSRPGPALAAGIDREM